MDRRTREYWLHFILSGTDFKALSTDAVQCFKVAIFDATNELINSKKLELEKIVGSAMGILSNFSGVIGMFSATIEKFSTAIDGLFSFFKTDRNKTFQDDFCLLRIQI